jgi:pimeloyl-ACP methyl ester carboxylesterase
MTHPTEALRPAPRAGDSHFTQANGLRFHYLTWGDPASPPILLYHGGGQTAHTWQRVANHLSDRYRLIAPDARGHGDTEWSPNGDYGAFYSRDDSVALVEALGLREFVLVGMSMGGLTAMAYAAQPSARLRGLVVVDVAPTVEDSGTERVMKFLRGQTVFADLDEAIAVAHAFNPRRSVENLRQTLPANLRTLPDGRLAWKWDPALFSNANAPRRDQRRLHNLWEQVAQIACPVLVVHGRESDILTPENGRKLAATVRDGRFVSIAGAGHTVQGDNPHSLAEALEAFLSEIRY